MSAKTIFTFHIDGLDCVDCFVCFADDENEAREIFSDWNVYTRFDDVTVYAGETVDVEHSGCFVCTRESVYSLRPYDPGSADYPGDFNCKRNR